MLVLVDSEALEAALKRMSEKVDSAVKSVHPQLTMAQLDTLKTDGSLEAMRDFFKNTVNTRFRVFSAPGKMVGICEVIGDSMQHVVTEVMTTHCLLRDDGSIDEGHTDEDIRIIFRSYNINSPHLTNETGTWTKWRELSTSDKRLMAADEATAKVDEAFTK
ncbi:hypothetical protein HDR61_05300 [bacterium]|nr:hypothetical protein [Bacteroidales bacterium]MBD5401124.1 hypothetical protein [bacterium]